MADNFLEKEDPGMNELLTEARSWGTIVCVGVDGLTYHYMPGQGPPKIEKEGHVRDPAILQRYQLVSERAAMLSHFLEPRTEWMKEDHELRQKVEMYNHIGFGLQLVEYLGDEKWLLEPHDFRVDWQERGNPSPVSLEIDPHQLKEVKNQ